MLLQSRDGIMCDCCGTDHRRDFIYYSLDVRQVDVTNSRITVDENSPVIFSLDVCPSCLSQIEQAIKANYRPTNHGVNCDLCETQMRGDFTYYNCHIAKVHVSLSGGRLVCKKCGEPAVDKQSCKCGSSEGIIQADQKVDTNFLQLAVCPTDYKQLSENAVRRRRTASESAKTKTG